MIYDLFLYIYIGPDEWATVAANCGNGKQSPINILIKNISADSRLTPVQFTGYQEIIKGVIINNGHTGKFT